MESQKPTIKFFGKDREAVAQFVNESLIYFLADPTWTMIIRPERSEGFSVEIVTTVSLAATETQDSFNELPNTSKDHGLD